MTVSMPAVFLKVCGYSAFSVKRWSGQYCNANQRLRAFVFDHRLALNLFTIWGLNRRSVEHTSNLIPQPISCAPL